MCCLSRRYRGRIRRAYSEEHVFGLNRASPQGFIATPCPPAATSPGEVFNFQIQGEAARRLEPGDAFFEPAGCGIVQFDNASAIDAAEIVCFYQTDSGERPAIEMLGEGMNSQLGVS